MTRPSEREKRGKEEKIMDLLGIPDEDTFFFPFVFRSWLDFPFFYFSFFSSFFFVCPTPKAMKRGGGVRGETKAAGQDA
jgi:hypothetical protein